MQITVTNPKDYFFGKLVIFKTKQWLKLLSLIKDFTSKHKQDFTANLTEFDLEVGELIGIQYKIESEIDEINEEE